MTNVKMLSIPEAHTIYGISPYAWYKWIKEGVLPAVRIGKKYLLNEQVVENFLKGECAAPAGEKSDVYEIKPIDIRSCY